MATTESSTGVSTSIVERLPSPFEVVYSILLIWAMLSAVWSLLKVLITHYRSGIEFEMSLIFVFFLFMVITQFFRMYFHLHSFDEAISLNRETHFISTMAPPFVYIDRVIRLALAMTLILLVEAGLLKWLISPGFCESVANLFGNSVMSAEQQDLAAGYAETLLVVFVLLIGWDLNAFSQIIVVKRDNNPRYKCIESFSKRFFYVNPSDDKADVLFESITNYFSTYKFLERLFGFLFGFSALVAFTTGDLMAIIFAVTGLTVFLIIFLFVGRPRSEITVKEIFFTPFKELRLYVQLLPWLWSRAFVERQTITRLTPN